MRIMGVDSGVNGACAVFSPNSLVPTPPGGIFDIPTVGEGNRRELHYAQLRDLIYALQPDVAFIEFVNARPGFRKGEDGQDEQVSLGASSIGRMMGAFYAIKAVVACLDIPLRVVTPQQWKKHFNLKGGKAFKDDARLLAIQRFPCVNPFLQRKKDQNRADAFLVAAYGAHRISREGGDDIPE